MREFCRETEVDPSFFSKVLSGKRSPPADEAVLRRIAQALELDAPSVIVASGRIPAEWRSLWENPAVFSAVHRIAAGTPFSSPTVSARMPREETAVRKSARGDAKREMAPPKSASWTSGKPSPVPKRESRKAPVSFGEELL